MNGIGNITGVATFPNAVPGYVNVDAFLYTGGSVSDLGGFPDTTNVNYPATTSTSTGINNCGIVTGYSLYEYGNINHGFIFANGTLHDLGTFGGSTSYAGGINAKGHVTGNAALPGNTISHAFLYTPGRGKQDIGTLGGDSSSGVALNDSDQITGSSDIPGRLVYSHAFLYSDGSMQDLGALYGRNSVGISINASGHVVGVTEFVDAVGNFLEHAFFYSNSVMRDITQDTSASSGGTYANSINDYDEIVGEEDDSNFIARAFIYVDRTMTDLNTLIGSASSQYFLESAVAINDRGQIVVNGTDNGTLTVLLLTPLTPTSRALFDATANCQ
jgi:probable HAF family extracellular repeat protein